MGGQRFPLGFLAGLLVGVSAGMVIGFLGARAYLMVEEANRKRRAIVRHVRVAISDGVLLVKVGGGVFVALGFFGWMAWRAL